MLVAAILVAAILVAAILHLTVLVAAILHLTMLGSRFTGGIRAAGLVGAVGFAPGLVAWVPQGPLGHEWARRSGTPRSLLAKPVGTRRHG